MADIKQAAKWMKEGKRVRLPWHAQKCYMLSPSRSGVYYHGLAEEITGEEDNWAQLSIDDLLADDWEIA